MAFHYIVNGLPDLETTYSEQRIREVSDFDKDGSADPATIDAAITKAEAIVDSYVSVRYDLSVVLSYPVIPGSLVDAATAIAYYLLSEGREEHTIGVGEPVRDMYDLRIAELKKLAAGEVQLIDPTTGLPIPTVTRISHRADPRAYTRETMKGY